ncbi:hypothetical protein DEO72_LG11g1353 [Vigna unguiculata]|uniref:Uncharacterized protein n=1 Tax=Vigna unguiculata TaxID=3917 RepID=A0A4D6NKN2_VIGUN|nr:hypothetical protein DEO72_LG11g1353 [Vigna unguiculata]
MNDGSGSQVQGGSTVDLCWMSDGDGMVEDGMEDAGAMEARVVVAMAAVTFLHGDWCVRWLS